MIHKLRGNGAAGRPLGLICVIGIILVPLPAAAMDFLVGVSLAASLGLLVLSLHIETVEAIIDSAMAQAQTAWSDVGGVAVTYGPGLAGALMVGPRSLVASRRFWAAKSPTWRQ